MSVVDRPFSPVLPLFPPPPLSGAASVPGGLGGCGGGRRWTPLQSGIRFYYNIQINCQCHILPPVPLGGTEERR